MPDNDANKQEIERLEAMLSSSQRMGSGYSDRVKAIEARLEELRSAR